MTPTLKVANGVEIEMPTLGTVRPFAELSQKRVTTYARKVLEWRYKGDLDSVSCSASYIAPEWHGSCKIHGRKLAFTISIL